MQVQKTLPYQGQVILQVFAYSFKHIKDIDPQGGKNPLSSLPKIQHPKTALAIATAAVCYSYLLSRPCKMMLPRSNVH
jgi:hypothetical protein